MKKIFLVIFSLALNIDSAAAALKIDITRGNASKIRLYILECNQNDLTSSEIADTITSDLSSTGFIDVRQEKTMECNDNASITNIGTTDDPDSLILTIATTVSDNQELEVKYRLIDTSIRRQVIGKVLESHIKYKRKLAHSIADGIYTKLTGDIGYFNTSIAHTSDIDNVRRVAIMDQDGANLRFITDGKHLILTPRFSPDGTKIVYMSYAKTQGKIFVRDLVKKTEHMVGNFSGVVSAPRFTPDGKSIILTTIAGSNTDIRVVSLENSTTKKLTVSRSINTSASYSPDQKKIVFNSDRSGSPQLYVMNADGSGQRRINFGSGVYTAPSWSPRGDLIAFTVYKNRQFYIGIMKTDGSGERILATGYLVEGPTWSPNGRLIAFTREEKASPGNKINSKIYIIDITGRNERILNTKHSALDPSWSKEMVYE